MKPAGRQKSQRTSSACVARCCQPQEQVEPAAMIAVRTAPAACVCVGGVAFYARACACEVGVFIRRIVMDEK